MSINKRWNKRQLLCQNDIKGQFLANHSVEKSYLYILGMGFDQRMCIGVKHFIETGLPFVLWKVNYNEGEGSPSHIYQDKSCRNREILDSITKDIEVREKYISFWQGDGRNSRNVAEINASKMIKASKDELSKFSDIIFDISAFPQALYLCMLNMLLNCCDAQQTIYIIVNENYMIDKETEPVEIDEFAHEMQGFASPTDDIDSVRIWYPILGEINTLVLKRHYDYLVSNSKHIDEICPVVPFPAMDVKRADVILKGYRKELFSDWKIDKKNIIYASETSPIRVCETLYETSMRYKKVLKQLGECRFVFSSITSKLMSMGVFLATHDLKSEGISATLLNVSNKGYKVNKIVDTEEKDLTCLVLSNA